MFITAILLQEREQVKIQTPGCSLYFYYYILIFLCNKNQRNARIPTSLKM